MIWGGALQHYKDVHTHIPKPHISSSMTESEKRSARAEYDRKVRERAQREENYKKLKAFTETQAKQAKQELEACYEEIEELYRNRIVVYENTDDEYKKTAMDLYQQCTDFGEKLSNFGVKSAKTVWDVRRGALTAVLDLVKTALAIQDLKNTLDTLPFAVVAEVMGIEVPGLSLEKVDDLKNMVYGAVTALQNPTRVLAAFGQKIGDTVEEEGIAYSISYVAADVAIQVLLSKGLGEVKNVSKADDLVDVARTVDTLDDTVKIADELTDAAKVLDQVGDIADAALAVNVMDEANAVVKAVDEVNDVSDAAKTVEKLDDVIESGIKSKNPMTGGDWHNYFNENYGADNVTWESASIQDIIDMPSKITDFSPKQISNLASRNGWTVEPLGKGRLAGIPYEQGGGISMHAPNGSSIYIQYHPGSGHHGVMPYYKISSGKNGIVRYYINGERVQ